MSKNTNTSKHMPLPREADIVIAAKTDSESFALLYDHYFPKIYKYIHYRVKNPNDVEDLTCAVFELVFTKLESYKQNRGPFGSWIFAIARNTVYDYYRKKKRLQAHTTEMPKFTEMQEKSNLEDVVLAKESCQELHKALRTLSHREQDIIALKFASGMTNRSIAASTGLTESNVGVILYRAIRRLRGKLYKEMEKD